MKKSRNFLFDFLVVLIISIPSFISLLNNDYFTIHDNQHPVRLFLLDQAIKQGYLYPRWVDKLTFGFGDPLFNFYPPLVYYIGEIFHLFGFSIIWSIKLVFIFGFILGAWGSYLFIKELLGKLAGFLGATIYTYFFYHLINAYVRGALSEFMAMNFVPFVFLYFYRLTKTQNIKNSLLLGLFIGLVLLSHQLVALPLVFFLFFFFIFYFFTNKKRWQFFKFSFVAGFLGLSLSSFYWLPMFYERQFTFLDKELGGYQDHFINPYQFWYSPWGFGASVKGIGDGMSFQLGKIPIFLISLSVISFFFYLLTKKKKQDHIKQFIFFLLLVFFGLWITTESSRIIWDKLKILWNLQFPWRFLSVTTIFIALVASYFLFFLNQLIKKTGLTKKSLLILTSVFIIITIFKYQKYSRPQSYLRTKDIDLITDEEIMWKQSQTVLHFVPKEAKAKKNQYGVYVLDIEKKDLPKDIYEIKQGKAKVKIVTNKFQEKIFQVEVIKPTIFQLNTFAFPGWTAYLDKQKIIINNNNDYQLINVNLPRGNYQLRFVFEDTAIRKIANWITLITIGLFIFFFSKTKYDTKKH